MLVWRLNRRSAATLELISASANIWKSGDISPVKQIRSPTARSASAPVVSKAWGSLQGTVIRGDDAQMLSWESGFDLFTWNLWVKLNMRVCTKRSGVGTIIGHIFLSNTKNIRHPKLGLWLRTLSLNSKVLKINDILLNFWDLLVSKPVWELFVFVNAFAC